MRTYNVVDEHGRPLAVDLRINEADVNAESLATLDQSDVDGRTIDGGAAAVLVAAGDRVSASLLCQCSLSWRGAPCKQAIITATATSASRFAMAQTRVLCRPGRSCETSGTPSHMAARTRC